MKFTLPSLLAVAVLAGLLQQPQPAYGQSKEIGALQRDIYDLSRKLDELKGGQAEKSAQTETLLKQVMDANAKLTADLQALQDTARKNQTDQQTRVIEPLSAMKVGLEDVSSGVAGVQANLATLRSRQEKMEGMLTDLSAAMRIVMKQTEGGTQAAPVSVAPTASDAAALLFASGQRDKLAGKPNFALETFFNLSQQFPSSPEAPMAVFEMGTMYAANGEYEQALKAFDRVLEQFGDNPMRKDAQFYKAEQLASLNRRADAIKELNSFAKQYPGDDKAILAINRVKELNGPATPNTSKSKAKGKAK